MVSAIDLSLYQESEFLKECAIAGKAFDLVQNECAYLESMMTNKLKLNLQQAELKVITESGSMDDMVLLANAAITEAEEAKPSIFAKFWTGITTFFTNIWNSVQKLFTGENTEAWNKLHASPKKVRFDYDVKAITDAADKAVGEMKKGVGIKGIITGAVAAVAGGATIGVLIKNHKDQPKPVEISGAEAVEVANKAKGIVSTITDFFKKTKPEEVPEAEQAEAQKQSNVFRTVLDFLNTHVIAPVAKAAGAIGGNKNAAAPADGAQPADPNAQPAAPAKGSKVGGVVNAVKNKLAGNKGAAQPAAPAQPAPAAAPAQPAQPAQPTA